MSLFKRKKSNHNPVSGPSCVHCGSTNTKIIGTAGTAEPDFVRTWRGQRYITCRCSDCGRDFYTAEGGDDSVQSIFPDENAINEDELNVAENELKRQIEENNDRRCK